MSKKDAGQRHRDKYHLSESFKTSPRINSLHSYATYDHMVEISRHIDFSHPRFMNRRKRNHSLGSVQALICEIGLTNRQFCEYLKQFMVNGGAGYEPTLASDELYDEEGFDLRRPEWSHTSYWIQHEAKQEAKGKRRK